MEPIFFATPAEFRAWLEQHHAHDRDVQVGYYKKDTGKPSLTWPESVDVALCFGWIDGIRKRIDEESYTIRFTPRKPRSIWSAVNIKRVAELTEQGLMQPTGLQAFAARSEARSNIYAYEQAEPTLDADLEQQFRANQAAWTFFEAQAAWYRKTAIWWVMSAKREVTKHKRLATLIDDSAHGRTIRSLTRSTTTD